MSRLDDITLGDLGRGIARYRPYIGLVVAIFLVVAFLPGDSETEDDTGQLTATGQTDVTSDSGSQPVAEGGESAAGETAVEGDAAADVGTGGTGGSGAPQQRTAVAPGGGFSVGPGGKITAPTNAVANCDKGTGRLMVPSRYAPPCTVAFSGQNDGATWQGVTPDKIRVALYMAEANPAAQAILAAANASDDDETVIRHNRELVQYFEAHYNTWGRKVELIPVRASGAATNDAAAKADAIKVATEIKAFASWGYPNNTYVDELVARKVMVFGPVSLPNEFYEERGPYVWASLMSSTQAYVHRAEYVGKRLAGDKAKWAGDPLFQQQDRRLGLLYYETKDNAYKAGIDFFVKELKSKYNVTLSSIAAYNGYPDIAATQQQARPLIQKMKEDKINSLIFSGDPFGPIFFTQEATRQQYFPEWIITGSALTDTTFFARLYDQQQWKNAFGISLLSARLPEELGDSYRLHMWHFGRKPSAKTHNVIRSSPNLFYLGVHLAGPKLTPQTFRDGMWSLPPTGVGMVTGPAVTFGPKGRFWDMDDYLAGDDTTEIWWDATARGKDDVGNEGTGMYAYVDGGRRYLPGQHPKAPPKAFDKNGISYVYDKPPPSDQWPEYPPPKR